MTVAQALAAALSFEFAANGGIVFSGAKRKETARWKIKTRAENPGAGTADRAGGRRRSQKIVDIGFKASKIR